MKPFITTILFALCSEILFAQCPSAGNDTSNVIYCKNESFTLLNLLSDDASENGIFIDPMGDTMTSPIVSIAFPGIFTFYYLVSDTGCIADSAKLVITIHSCGSGGLTEAGYENNDLMYPNPVSDHISLQAPHAERLVIYSSEGQQVLTLSAPFSSNINLSHLTPGSYILVVENDTTRQFRRFVKN